MCGACRVPVGVGMDTIGADAVGTMLESDDENLCWGGAAG
jgi:hypothetical protein